MAATAVAAATSAVAAVVARRAMTWQTKAAPRLSSYCASSSCSTGSATFPARASAVAADPNKWQAPRQHPLAASLVTAALAAPVVGPGTWPWLLPLPLPLPVRLPLQQPLSLIFVGEGIVLGPRNGLPMRLPLQQPLSCIVVGERPDNRQQSEEVVDWPGVLGFDMPGADGVAAPMLAINTRKELRRWKKRRKADGGKDRRYRLKYG
mmetsp:Transcript_151952/g.487740  ORF Transcript_151952/g.487740 Transcript_151952/m.487740 type:complete len:207 (-) Transcript_151952:89-709(-)